MFLAASTFITGYLGIIFEHKLRIDKAATALITGILCWLFYFVLGSGDFAIKASHLQEHLSDISQVVFFLLGAMLIVDLIEAHKGFEIISKKICFPSKLLTFWLIILSGFFLSSVLDNLTTIIVMISLLKKIIPEKENRLILSAALVPIVNAGGAWTPIGDITTTMLWIGDCISSFEIIKTLFIPCIITMIVTGFLVYRKLPSDFKLKPNDEGEAPKTKGSFLILISGLTALIAVPALKSFFNLPPFMGMLLGVGILWAMTDFLHHNDKESSNLRMMASFKRIDISTVLFFLGILLAVDALESLEILKESAVFLQKMIPSHAIFASLLGVLSAVVDNVPLVAATIRMFPLEDYPINHALWNMIAYSVGVGGSLLVIGSAPGIALMSLERVSFSWYFKNLSLIILISYIAGSFLTWLFS